MIYQDNKLMNETSTFPDAFIDEPYKDDYSLRTDFGNNNEAKTVEDFKIIKKPNAEQTEKAVVTRLIRYILG